MGLKRQFGFDFQVWAISKAKCKSYSWKIKMGKFGRFFECPLIYDYVHFTPHRGNLGNTEAGQRIDYVDLYD